MIKFTTIIFFGIITMFYACEKPNSTDDSIYIFKFKEGTDYSMNVPVEVSDDGTKITSSPVGILNEKYPLALIDGYYLNGNMGCNTGYLSLTIADHNLNYNDNFSINNLSMDSLSQLLIAPNPYLECYYRSDDRIFKNGNGIDTTIISNLIRNNELNDYFDRYK